MLDDKELLGTLDRIDWNFPGSSTPERTVHSLHWFPGNFIPQIPSYLVQLLSEPGDLVCDPFCGSGTTGVEAIQLGRRTWLSDLNRASIQVTRGKIAAIVNPQINKDLQLLLRDIVWKGMLRTDRAGRNNEGDDPELAHWFHPDTLAQLRHIWTLVESAPYDHLRYLLEVIFSDTLFGCASVLGTPTSTGRRRRHHWGWIADNVRPKQPLWHNAIKLFRERVIHAIDVVHSNQTFSPDTFVIRRQDIRSLSLLESSVDLVVTSPPYLGMIDYALANRLTYLWLGWPLREDQDAEIGARRRRNRLRAKEEYLDTMTIAVRNIVKSLKGGRFCAIVVGASRKYPDAAHDLIDVFGRHLEVVWGPRARIPTRRRVSDSHGSGPEEWICILRKSE